MSYKKKVILWPKWLIFFVTDELQKKLQKKSYKKSFTFSFTFTIDLHEQIPRRAGAYTLWARRAARVGVCSDQLSPKFYLLKTLLFSYHAHKALRRIVHFRTGVKHAKRANGQSYVTNGKLFSNIYIYISSL